MPEYRIGFKNGGEKYFIWQESLGLDALWIP